MLDRHLAELYGVQTKVFNQAVQRNILRFPDDDFMFQLTKEELDNWRSQIVTSNKDIDIREKIARLEKEYEKHDQEIKAVFNFINKLFGHMEDQPEKPKKIGF